MYKVMIIDDEPIIVEGLSRSIAWDKWNCEVIATAHDGLEGKKKIEELHPDILFLDICMPEMNGLQMIAAIKSQYADIEISILTGFRDFDYAQQAIRLGVTRFLLKPSNMEELVEAIDTMCKNLDSRRRILAGETGVDAAGSLSGAGSVAEAADAAAGAESDTAQTADGLSDMESGPGSFIVNNALKYIEENYKNKLTLCEVAEKTYVSQWHLSKLLNRHTGKSFSEILNHIRIEEAKKLLADPSLRIGDISETVGFLDLAHFSRVFKKQVGVSANEYRNHNL